MVKGKKKKGGEPSEHPTAEQVEPRSPVQEELTDEEFLQKYTGENNQAIWFRNIIRAQAKHVMKEAITQEVCKATENIELQLKEALSMTENLTKTLADFKESTKQKIAGLCEEIEALKQDNVKKQRRIEKLEFHHSQQQSKTTCLESKMDDFEQQSYDTHLQVVGLPESDENQCDTKKFMKLCKDKLGVKIKASDIEETTRLGRKKNDGKARHLLVKLKTQDIKDKVQKDRSKLVTHAAGASNIYLNDRLTKYRQNLLFAARKLVKDKKLFSAWSQRGNVLVRKTDKSKILQVHDHNELMEIKLSFQNTKNPSEDSVSMISHLSDYDFSYDSDL